MFRSPPILLIGVVGASILWSEGAVSQVNILPPPAVSPVPRPPPSVNQPPKPVPSRPAQVERPFDATFAVSETVKLQGRLSDCEAEKIRVIENSVSVEGGRCSKETIDTQKALLKGAQEVLDKKCPLKEIADLHKRVADAKEDLRRQGSSVSSGTAKKILADVMEAYERNDPLLDMLAKRADGYREELVNKIQSIGEVLVVCERIGGITTTPMEPQKALVDAARKEGALSVMALPRNWCGYGDLIDRFQKKYGIVVKDLNANANSREQANALRTSVNSATLAPDVIEISIFEAPALKR